MDSNLLFFIGVVTGAMLICMGMYLTIILFRAFGLEVVKAPPMMAHGPEERPFSLSEFFALHPDLSPALEKAGEAVERYHEEIGQIDIKAKENLDRMAEGAATRVKGLRADVRDPLAEVMEEVG